MTQPRLPSMSVPGPLLTGLQTNPLARLGETGGRSWNELWSKLRWALGTAYDLPYTKTSDCGKVAHRIALHLVDTNGLPNAKA